MCFPVKERDRRDIDLLTALAQMFHLGIISISSPLVRTGHMAPIKLKGVWESRKHMDSLVGTNCPCDMYVMKDMRVKAGRPLPLIGSKPITLGSGAHTR